MTSKLYFCSDTHFGHRLMLERRGQFDLDQHDEALQHSLARVGPDATLYILGDASFRPAKRTVAIMQDLRRRIGRIILVKGNHDRNLTKTQEREAYDEVHNYLEINVQDQDCPHGHQLICMMHYAMAAWRNRHWGAWMLHGHWHGTGPSEPGRLDVGVDALGWTSPVISYDELKLRLPERYGTVVRRGAPADMPVTK